MYLHIYEECSKETRMGNVQGDGVQAVKTVLMGTGTGIPLMHQLMDSLYQKSRVVAGSTTWLQPGHLQPFGNFFGGGELANRLHLNNGHI
jgi:hypothetical protein